MGKIEGGEERFLKVLTSPIRENIYWITVYKSYYTSIDI